MHRQTIIPIFFSVGSRLSLSDFQRLSPEGVVDLSTSVGAGPYSSLTPSSTAMRTPSANSGSSAARSNYSSAGPSANSAPTIALTGNSRIRRAPIAFTSPEQRLAAVLEHIRLYNFGTQVDEILLEAGLTDEEYVQFPRASQFINPDHSHLDEDDDERCKFFLNLITV